MANLTLQSEKQAGGALVYHIVVMNDDAMAENGWIYTKHSVHETVAHYLCMDRPAAFHTWDHFGSRGIDRITHTENMTICPYCLGLLERSE